jgi:hypothetical protein
VTTPVIGSALAPPESAQHNAAIAKPANFLGLQQINQIFIYFTSSTNSVDAPLRS